MTEPSSSSTIAQSEVSAGQLKPAIKPNKPKKNQVTQVIRDIGPNDTHCCPYHRTADECANERIKSVDEEISSTLIDPTITFNETPEQLRDRTPAEGKLLPASVFRVFYEGSATLASRVSKDTHVRHRENESLKLRPGNAFQTVGEVDLNRSVTKEDVTRHLVWNKKNDPSKWISTFHDMEPAKRRARFHYDESKRIGQRVTIAEISTDGLVPATLHAKSKTTWKILTRDKYYGKREHISTTTRRVDVPIWVHHSARPADKSEITGKQFMASQADLLISIEEIRISNLVEGPNYHSSRRTIQGDGHNYEWLALGRIREDRIVKVIPFDGKAFHMEKPSYTVRSQGATEDWIFDFEAETWRLESQMSSMVRKRKADGDINEVQEVGSKDVHKHKKRSKQVLNLSPIETIYASI